jgi:hypothetical protein
MRRISFLTAPVVIAAIGGLTLGVSGTAVASHLVTSKDIKNHTIKTRDLASATIKKLNPAQTDWYGAHMTILNEGQDTAGWGSPVGYSQSESSSLNFVDELGPLGGVHETSFEVLIQNGPGTNVTRDFYLLINDVKGPACSISGAATHCAIGMDRKIPAGAQLVIESDVSGGTAQGADAAIGWTTSG